LARTSGTSCTSEGLQRRLDAVATQDFHPTLGRSSKLRDLRRLAERVEGARVNVRCAAAARARLGCGRRAMSGNTRIRNFSS